MAQIDMKSLEKDYFEGEDRVQIIIKQMLPYDCFGEVDHEVGIGDGDFIIEAAVNTDFHVLGKWHPLGGSETHSCGINTYIYKPKEGKIFDYHDLENPMDSPPKLLISYYYTIDLLIEEHNKAIKWDGENFLKAFGDYLEEKCDE